MNEINRELIGKRIKERREICNLTQEQVGDKIGKKFTTVAKYESGEIKNIDIMVLSTIADMTNTNIDYLLLKSNNPEVKMIYNETNKDEIKAKPLPVLGRISAGIPLYAEEQLEGYMYAPESILKPDYEYFYLRVEGDSMNLKFNDGDLVLVQKQTTLENGEIGVIRVNGDDATIKRFKTQGNFIILEPMSTNTTHMVQIYNPKEIEINIIGKAIWKTGKI